MVQLLMKMMGIKLFSQTMEGLLTLEIMETQWLTETRNIKLLSFIPSLSLLLTCLKIIKLK